MSVYASLGEEAPAIRDTLVSRLSALSSPRQLITSILQFISVAIQTQPSLTELFLALQKTKSTAQEAAVSLYKPNCIATAVAAFLNSFI